jgi:hypothetical protein
MERFECPGVLNEPGWSNTMTERPPEGPKANYTHEQATGGYIPKPPSDAELDKLSEAQALITDDWTGEPPASETPPKAP